MTKDIDPEKIAEAYSMSHARLMLLDYDGTLVPLDISPQLTKVDAKTKRLLHLMASDPKNDVVLISGRDRNYLDSQWQDPPMTMVAEHGGFYKGKEQHWQQTFSYSTKWIRNTVSALKALAFQYEGSFVEEKTFSIAWHYRAIKERVTEEDKRQILAAIRVLPERQNFRICDCEYTIELRSHGIQKGAFTSFWASKRYYDFIMAIGDGQTDEDLFKILDKTAYSIKVGKSNRSDAVYHLNSQSEVFPFLQSLLNFDAQFRQRRLAGSLQHNGSKKLG
jgi:trehalose 6-phosphate synthase/phosphatase